jgi:hypothetical protein
MRMMRGVFIYLGDSLTSDFIFFAVFVKEAPYVALGHAFYLWEVIEGWETVLLFCRGHGTGKCGSLSFDYHKDDLKYSNCTAN